MKAFMLYQKCGLSHYYTAFVSYVKNQTNKPNISTKRVVCVWPTTCTIYHLPADSNRVTNSAKHVVGNDVAILLSWHRLKEINN